MRRLAKIGPFIRLRQVSMQAWQIRFQRHRTRSSRAKASMRHSVPPATVETSTVRVRQPGGLILPRPTSPILRRSPCSRKATSSGGSRRAASASRSKECHGNQPCLAGNSSFPMSGSGKSSWVSTTERINRLGHGSSGADGLSPLLADRAPSEGPRSTRAVEGNQTRLVGDGGRWNL
jgi:hypothetical protein